jgi:hypothetical protein
VAPWKQPFDLLEVHRVGEGQVAPDGLTACAIDDHVAAIAGGETGIASPVRAPTLMRVAAYSSRRPKWRHSSGSFWCA